MHGELKGNRTGDLPCVRLTANMEPFSARLLLTEPLLWNGGNEDSAELMEILFA